MGAIVTALDRYGSTIEFRNTWGDGLCVVTADAETAADCAENALSLYAAEPWGWMMSAEPGQTTNLCQPPPSQLGRLRALRCLCRRARESRRAGMTAVRMRTDLARIG
jgi:hypothetical protein